MQPTRVLWLALVCIAACDSNRVVDTPTIAKRIPVNPDLDVLFVIDNSASTQDKQDLFAQNFARLAQKLDAYPGGRPNLHLGIVSTTVGTGSDADFGASCAKVMPMDDGRLVHTPRVAAGCTGPNGAFFSDISDGMGGRITNYTGTLPDAFACIAQVGTQGCGFEAPLEAMKRALDGSLPENAGFLRPDADLAVVVLTDEDDCSVSDPALFSQPNVGPGDFRCQPLYAYDCDQPISATAPGHYTSCTPRHDGYLADPSAYVAFLHSIKDPSQTLFALIAGDPSSTIDTGTISTPFAQSLALEPSCQTTINGNLAIGRPALRLDAVRQAFGERGVFASVCQADYSPVLDMLGDSMLQMMSSCLEGDLDTTDRDAMNPGLQLGCTVTLRDALGTPSEADLAIPACTMADATTPAPAGTRPCWWVQPDSTCSTTGVSLRIERLVPAPAGSVVDAECALRATR